MADVLHIETPTFESIPITCRTGKTVCLKMDCFQPTGSFKIRGVGLRCRECVETGATHLVSSSGGNAGLAVAYAGRKLGVRVTVAVPETASDDVRSTIAREGADVIVHGAVWDETHAQSQRAFGLRRTTGPSWNRPAALPFQQSTMTRSRSERLSLYS
jgi:L-serine/L-threonine ammonia-lyase